MGSDAVYIGSGENLAFFNLRYANRDRVAAGAAGVAAFVKGDRRARIILRVLLAGAMRR